MQRRLDNWKFSILTIVSEPHFETVSKVPITDKNSILELCQKILEDENVPINTKEVIKGLDSVDDYFGSVVVTTPQKLNEALRSITDGYGLLIYVDYTLVDTPINLSELGGTFYVTIMPVDVTKIVASMAKDGSSTLEVQSSVSSIFQELAKLRGLVSSSKLSRKDYISRAAKAFSNVFGTKSVDLRNYKKSLSNAKYGVTLTCGPDDSLDKTVDFLSLTSGDLKNAFSYRMDKKCHVPAVAFPTASFVDPENANKMDADYCLMSLEMWRLNDPVEMSKAFPGATMKPTMFKCRDVGLYYQHYPDDTVGLKLYDDGIVFQHSGNDYDYLDSWKTGNITFLSTSNTLVNRGGTKVNVVVSLSETATNVKKQLNISAQTLNDYSLAIPESLIMPGYLASFPEYDDPYMELIFDEASD